MTIPHEIGPQGLRPLLKSLRATLPLALGALAAVGHAQAPAPGLPLKRAPRPTQAEISAEDLMTRLYIFADDSMEGRRYMAAGNVKGTNYLAAELKRLGLEQAGDSGTYFQTMPYDSAQGQHPPRNVVAILRGSDPKLNQTYVAIGAHNDHIGVRQSAVDHDSVRAFRLATRRVRQTIKEKGIQDKAVQDSLMRSVVVNMDSLRKLHPARRDSIGNGADDDGSGSVAVLEIAEALAKLPKKPKRSILFVWHTGEEAGLLGSAYFMEHPTVPRDSIVTQVNLDMIGRGRAEDTPEGGPDMVMAVGANQISSELGKIVEAANTEKGHKLRLDYSWDAPDHPQGIYGRSDHASYARRGIPIVFFFTGLHVDYHQVTDEPQYIDYPHLTKITKYVYDLVLELGTRPTRPAVDKPVTKPGE
jgi:hypothetical protein